LLAGVGCGCDGIGEVVEAVKKANDVVRAARVADGVSYFESRPIYHSRFSGSPRGDIDRGLMGVDAKESGCRKGGGEKRGGDSFATTDVGDGGAGLETVSQTEGRDPIVNERLAVGGAEESSRAPMYPFVLVTPVKAATRKEEIGHLLHIHVHPCERFEPTGE
jgi:hypothetical protein